MSTVKITALPSLSAFAGANTGNATFIGVDISQDKTVQFTGTTLAQQLYLNNSLVVGNNTIQLPNTIAQFSGNSNSYLQINAQNFNPNGSVDVVLTADDGTDLVGYIDLGLNNSQFNANAVGQTSQFPHDGYLIVDGPGANSTGNLVIGTANPGTNVVFAVGGYLSNNIVAVVAANGIVMNTNTFITFADGTKITTANVITNLNTYAYSAYSEANAAWILANAAFGLANTDTSALVSTITFVNAMANTTNLAYTEANNAASFANAAFTEANTTYSSLISVATFLNSIANTANLAYTEANSASAWANAINATQNTNITAAFNQANLANSIANTAVQNTSTIQINNLNVSGNVVSSGNINGAYMFGNQSYMTGSVTATTIIANSYTYSSNTTATAIQTGSRTTLVYANGTSGVIVGYNASALQHQTGYVFTVYNSSVLHPSDIVIVSVQSTNCPVLQVSTANTRAGSFDVAVYNASSAGNDAAYTMNLNFGIIRVGS